jgi:hypothetical protein
MKIKTISGYSGALSLRGKGDYGIGASGNPFVVSTLQNWNLTHLIAVQEHFASNTGRFAVQMPGVENFNGSYSRFATVPVEALGKTYLFNGYAGNTVMKGGKQHGTHYRGAIVITGFDITYTWESRDANQYTTNFISNWCEEGDELTTFEDEAIVDVPSAANPRTFMQPAAGGIRFKRLADNGTPIPANTPDGWAALCVKYCSLNFNIQPIIDNNSCSGQFQHVLEGGNISCGINTTVSSSDFDDVSRVGGNLLLRIYPALCSPSSFWEFCAFTNVSLSNLNVDVEGGSAVNFTLQGQFNMNPGLCSTVNVYIIDPNNRYWAGGVG